MSSATYFQEVSTKASQIVVTNGLFRGKKPSKISIFDVIIVKQNGEDRPGQFMFFRGF